jgi:hypothetical protein
MQDKLQCPREPQFIEMYSALGDRVKQDRIRASTPNVYHCPFLKESEMACLELPESAAALGDLAPGVVCPNNPYVKHAGLLEQVEDYAILVDRAMTVYAEHELGFYRDLSEMSPEEYEMLLISRNAIQEYQAELNRRMAEEKQLNG